VSVRRFKDDLIAHLMAELWATRPLRLRKVLKRHQFKPGDVTFRRTKTTGKPWATIERWPWGAKESGL
jgi:hypothetical protein